MKDDEYSQDDFIFDVRFWSTGLIVVLISAAFMAHCSGIL